MPIGCSCGLLSFLYRALFDRDLETGSGVGKLRVMVDGVIKGGIAFDIQTRDFHRKGDAEFRVGVCRNNGDGFVLPERCFDDDFAAILHLDLEREIPAHKPRHDRRH